MRFKILSSSEIDIAKWNERVYAQDSEIYNEYHYLSACTMDDWYGIVWGDYEKILPFYQKKKWGLIPYICMPPFCQKFDTSSISMEMFQEVLNYFKTNYWIVDYQINNQYNIEGFEERKNYIIEKSENENPSDLYSSQLIRILSKSKLVVESSDLGDSELDFLKKNDAFRINVAKKHMKQFHNFIFNKNISRWQKAIKIDDKIEGLLIAPSFRNQAYLLFPFSSKKGKKAQGMSVLMDHILKDSQFQRINFEGSSIDSIARFYEQFGAKKEVYWSLNWEKYRFLRFLS